MSEVKKLSLEEALKATAVERHNSAISNVVCVLTAIEDKRVALRKALAKCDEDEAWARKLAEQTEADPVSVNDDDKLHQLYVAYGNARGQRF